LRRWGFLYFWRGSLFEKRWLLWLLVLSVLGPQIANQAGWFAAEVGRQPWIVYKLLRTSEGLSAVVKANTVLLTSRSFCSAGLPAAVRRLHLTCSTTKSSTARTRRT
jgi:cytochrome d ubiquinol oxidase subunit I